MNSEYSIVTNNSVGSSLISGISGSIEYLLVSDVFVYILQGG